MGEANCFKRLGDVHYSLLKQDYISAQHYYEQNQQLCQTSGHQQGIVDCWEGLAQLHSAQGHFEQAQHAWQQAIALYEQLGMFKRAEKCRHEMLKTALNN